MKVFLAGTERVWPENKKLIYGGYNLMSYYYIKKDCADIIQNSKMFLLDSGAFSFSDNKKGIDWEKYIQEYAEFINKNNIEYFFELDIDNIVGYEKVLGFRKKLETLTGKKCIPVWHKNRGIAEYKKMCDEYKYVSIGGIGNEIHSKQYNCFIPMVSEAHKRGAKIHGLGFTSSKLLKKIHFDSVDSTNWSYGRFGHFWEFTPDKEMIMHHRPLNKICDDRKGLQAHNLNEWKKFQKYADVKL